MTAMVLGESVDIALSHQKMATTTTTTAKK